MFKKSLFFLFLVLISTLKIIAQQDASWHSELPEVVVVTESQSNNDEPSGLILMKDDKTISVSFQDTIRWHSELPEINIQGNDKQRHITPTVSLLNKEYKRMPAAFQDPVRLLMRKSGFVIPNDGSNHISYRGLPPEAMQWQLEGVRIVNPNHLSNAGTLDDNITYNGGGALGFPASIMGAFEYDGLPTTISNSNSFGGTANISLSNHYGSYVDLGLLGFEGGIKFGNKKHEHFVTVRNSFVGLLSALGTDFGGEKINFSDVSFHSSLIKNNKESLSFFGNVGLSQNHKNAVDSFSLVTTIKDTKKINYDALYGVLGLKYTKETGFDNQFSIVLATSGREDKREESIIYQGFGDVDSQKSLKELIPVSLHAFHIWRKDGDDEGEFNNFTIGIRNSVQQLQFNNDDKYSIWNVYPYGEVDGQILTSSGKTMWGISSGIGFDLIRLRPNLSLKLSAEINKKHLFFYKSSLSFPGTFGYLELKKGMIATADVGYQWKRSNSSFKLTAYNSFYDNLVSYLFTLPSNQVQIEYSILNGNLRNNLDIYSMSRLLSSTLSNVWSRGIEAEAEKTWTIKGNKIQLFCNTTLGKMSVQSASSNTINLTRYSYPYALNSGLTFDKLWNNYSNKRLSFGLVFHSHSGELVESYDQNIFNDMRLNSFWRFDIRTSYYYLSKGGHTHRWSLDIQNVTNRLNEFGVFYDSFLNQPVVRTQLGLIPVLSYRYEL
jgi:hypothetical protein